MNLSDFDWAGIITKVVAAIVILVITWLVAKLVKSALSKLLGRVKALSARSDNGETTADSLASVGSLIVWLFGLIAVLNVFALTSAVSSLQKLVGGVLGFVPQIIAAGLIMFIGIILAKVARQLVVTALQAANVDRHASKLGQKTSDELATGVGGDVAAGQGSAQAGAPAAGSGGPKISEMAGQLVFGVVVIVMAIAALQALDIKAISGPAVNMLHIILEAIPNILAAVILLVIGVVIAKLVASLLESLLRGIDFDKGLASVGVDTEGKDIPGIITKIVQIAIVLFFAIAAANMLRFPQITEILNTILALGGHIAFGGAIIAAGVLIAGVLAKLVGQGTTATITRFAVIALFAAVGLRYMGLANSIINMAFGALVIGAAAAGVLAFGLGGRDAAARQLEKMREAGSKE